MTRNTEDIGFLEPFIGSELKTGQKTYGISAYCCNPSSSTQTSKINPETPMQLACFQNKFHAKLLPINKAVSVPPVKIANMLQRTCMEDSPAEHRASER